MEDDIVERFYIGLDLRLKMLEDVSQWYLEREGYSVEITESSKEAFQQRVKEEYFKLDVRIRVYSVN